jgi:hypothetical protein
VLSKIPRNYDRERLETLWVTLGASSLRYAMTKRAVVGARVGLRGKHGHLRRWRSFPFAGFWHRRVHIQRVTLNAISHAPNLHAALLWTRKTQRKMAPLVLS